jgi:hypothetical protein
MAVGISTGPCYVGIVGGERIKHSIIMSPVVGEAMSLCRATQTFSCDVLLPFNSVTGPLDGRFILRIVGFGIFEKSAPNRVSDRLGGSAEDSSASPLIVSVPTKGGMEGSGTAIDDTAGASTGGVVNGSTTKSPGLGSASSGGGVSPSPVSPLNPPLSKRELIAELLPDRDSSYWTLEGKGLREEVDNYNTVLRLISGKRLEEARRLVEGADLFKSKWYKRELQDFLSKGELHSTVIDPRW